jgi:hypothetical protein
MFTALKINKINRNQIILFVSKTFIMDDMMNSVSPESDFTPMAFDYLKRAGRWMRFFAILWFLLIGLFVLGGFGVMGTMQEGALIGIVYIIFSVILFFPALYLYQSSQSIHQYSFTRDKMTLQQVMQKLYSYWYFMGMLTIIYLVLLVLGMILFFSMYSTMKGSLNI